MYVYILRYYFFFYFDLHHFLFPLFFFQYAHQQWHVRDIEFTYDGRRGQKHGSNVFIMPCEIFKRVTLRIKESLKKKKNY